MEPQGDLLLGFWSDELVHEVLPCFDESEQGHRYTKTIWLVSETEAAIADPEDPQVSAIRAKHFGDNNSNNSATSS